MRIVRSRGDPISKLFRIVPFAGIMDWPAGYLPVRIRADGTCLEQLSKNIRKRLIECLVVLVAFGPSYIFGCNKMCILMGNDIRIPIDML